MNHDNPLCRGCGACCRDNVPVEADENVPASMTVEIGGRRWMRPHAVAPWCGALDLQSRRCTIYDQRPIACRAFVVGGAACDRARRMTPEGAPT